MYFMYVDESGSSGYKDKTRRHLCLTGVIVHESDVRNLDGKLNAIKKHYLKQINFELKSNEIRRQENIYQKLSDRNYKKFIQSLAEFIENFDFYIITIIIDVPEYKRKKYSKKINPYDKAYQLLLERYDFFLKDRKSRGIVVMDSKTGKLGFISRSGDSDSKMRFLHMKLQYIGSKYTRRLLNIVGGIFFVDSKYVNGVQLADLCCYPFYYRYENSKLHKNYKLMMGKVYKGKDGSTIASGFKVFPRDKYK